jgi:hypothetical protein
MSKYVGAGKKLLSYLVPKPKVNTTKLGKATSELNKAIQKNKASRAKLGQTVFEMKNDMPITFKSNRGKSESNKEAYKRITGENNKVIKNMLDKATENKKDGGRMGLKSGSKNRMQDALRAASRDFNKTGQGEKFREATFVDSKTNRIVPDTERNRKRYGEDRVKATTAKGVEKKAMGGRIGRKMGGGSDMGNTNIKKKFKNLGNLPESIQIKIAGKKIAKKV